MRRINSRGAIVSSCGLLFGLSLIAGCHGERPADPQTRTITYALPTITAQAETNLAQKTGGIEKGGVEISIVPVTYDVTREDRITYTPTQPTGVAAFIHPSSDEPQIFVNWVQDRAIAVAPDRVAFLVKINNKLPRVFRGAGTVVQFNVAGKVQPVSQEGYEPLRRGDQYE